MVVQRPRHLDRIIRDPDIMAGKPVVKGTRIPVERVIQHLAENPDINDIFAAFPHLTVEDVQACLAYAYERLQQTRRLPQPTGVIDRAASA